MEALGHQKAIKFLLSTGLIITAFISDRHASVTKWTRDVSPQMWEDIGGKPVIKHFFIYGTLGKVRLTE